jgi:hypothetical protein
MKYRAIGKNDLQMSAIAVSALKLRFALFTIVLLIGSHLSAQSTEETKLLQLSDKIFHLEVESKIDSLENLFDEHFLVVGSDGVSQTKAQYIARLRSGDFVHNDITISENNAIVSSNTASVFGKGKFTVTVSGNKVIMLLSYIEVFTRQHANAEWKVLAMHASKLQE